MDTTLLINFIKVFIGFAALIGGAELCVRGACHIAQKLHISKTLIGLTVVAFGTSLPEMFVSFVAAFQNEPSIAVGNVVGSNIANITLILGCAALMMPLMTDKGIIRKEIPLMIAAAVMIFIFALSGSVSRLEGIVLLAMFVFFTLLSIRRYMKEVVCDTDDTAPSQSTLISLLIMASGFILLFFGGDWVVDGGKSIARSFGVSEWLIGMTIVALGTSLPELATSVVAAFKGQIEISLGNVIGSNLFNSLCVLGGAALISPPVVQHIELYRDILIMVVISIAIYPLAIRKMQISRFEGAFLLLFYISFMISLILSPEWSIF